MKAQIADNGWPGIFIPGDEALALASDFRSLATALENRSMDTPTIADFLRRKADALADCHVSNKSND